MNKKILVTVQLLSEIDFENHLNALIEQRQSNAPALFSRLLFITQNSSRANSFLTIDGTDFEFHFPLSNNNQSIYLHAEPVIYDNGWSCSMSEDCTPS